MVTENDFHQKIQAIEPLKLWGKELVYPNSMKYLVVILNTKLNWKNHILKKKGINFTSLVEEL